MRRTAAPSTLAFLTIALVAACASTDDNVSNAVAYDLYGLLGDTEAEAEAVLGAPRSVGDRFDYSERGHEAFSATYKGGAKATFLVNGAGEGCLVRVEFEGAGAKRPSTSPFDGARYGFPSDAVSSGRRETDYSWERVVRIPSGYEAVIQEGRAGHPGTGALWYTIRSESVYEACGFQA